MVRTVWTGLICLIVIGGLTAYRVGFATPAQNQAGSVVPTAAMADAQAVLAVNDAPVARDNQAEGPATKTDRLDVDYLQDTPGKTLVHTISIVISNPATPAMKADPDKAAPEKSSKIVSRHWRSSYARYTRRHFRHQREVSRPTTEAKTGSTGLFGWLKPKPAT